MKHPTTKWVKMLSLLFILALLLPTFTGVASESTGVGFGVRPNLPSNQRNRGQSYFDLRVAPDTKQEITLEITSTAQEPIAISVALHSGYTNSVGFVDYMLPDVRDESMKLSIVDVVALENSHFILDPLETKSVVVSLDLQQKEFDGELVGGIIITKDLEEEEEALDEAVIMNQYSYVIGLVLSQNDNPVPPHLELVTTEASLVNYRTTIVHSIRNSQPLLMDQVEMTFTITPVGGTDPLWVLEPTMLKLAPQSLMEYAYYLEEQNVEPGEYETHVRLAWQGETWEFTDRFTVDATEAKELNQENAWFSVDEEPILPSWLGKALVAVLLLILLGLLFIAYRMVKEQSKSKHDKGDGDNNGI